MRNSGVVELYANGVSIRVSRWLLDIYLDTNKVSYSNDIGRWNIQINSIELGCKVKGEVLFSSSSIGDKLFRALNQNCFQKCKLPFSLVFSFS